MARLHQSALLWVQLHAKVLARGRPRTGTGLEQQRSEDIVAAWQFAQREQHGPTTRAPIVLVVESNILVRLALTEYLRDSGYSTLEAGDADEAIQLLESSGCAVDVVFSEIDVPGRIDGYGLARWIRSKGLATRVLLTSVASRVPRARI